MFCIILVVILVVIGVNVYKIDRIDRTHPFGSDNVKNNKYAKGISGDHCGVNTYWGKPSPKDDILTSLNKTEWLSNSYTNDVLWRRSLAMGILCGILISFAIDYKILLDEPSKLLCIVLMVSFAAYFSVNYYKHHLLLMRTKFINTHLRKIKKKLDLPLNNKINDNFLII